MSSAPKVMVSSTFYDLRQIRTDLQQFITNDLGYTALLSELSSFPVDPDSNAIENCRARVEKDADILVLVIGGRYGSLDNQSEKSITNLEFLAARQKGIPIYAFVEKRILALVPVWKRNQSGDFSAEVDTPKLFAFVEHVQSDEKVWTFPFETAQDIVRVLRLQLAYLFYDSLRLRSRLSGSVLPDYFYSLGTRSLRTVLERPRAWEFRLFLEALMEEVDRRAGQFKEYSAGLTLDVAEFVPASNAIEWILTRFHELEGLVESANTLFNSSAQEAFGPPGQSGNPGEIVWVTHMLGDLLDNAFKWARRIRCARIEEPFESLKPELVFFVQDIFKQFQKFPGESLKKLEDALQVSDRAEPVNLTMHIVLSSSVGFNRVLEDVRLRYNRNS